MPATCQGSAVDLQLLHDCGADCGGAAATDWLAYRSRRFADPPSGIRCTIYDRVRRLRAQLGRSVTVADLRAEDAEHAPTEAIRASAQALERRRIAATPRMLPPGPPPIPASGVITTAAPTAAPRATRQGRPSRRKLRGPVPHQPARDRGPRQVHSSVPRGRLLPFPAQHRLEICKARLALAEARCARLQRRNAALLRLINQVLPRLASSVP